MFTDLLRCVERLARLLESMLVPNITTNNIQQAFVNMWVCRHGCLWIAKTYSNRQFQCDLSLVLTKLMGIRYVQTAAYHPSENGMVVQFHRQIKTAPTAHGDSDHCKTHLAMVLLGIRSPLKPDMGCTTAQLVFNTPPSLAWGIF